MPKTTAPFKAPPGRKWCVRHNKGGGAFLPESYFHDVKYSYCRDCKREYQRLWDKTKRQRKQKAVEPSARLSADERKIILHLPNTEKGRNVTREIFSYWPDVDLDW